LLFFSRLIPIDPFELRNLLYNKKKKKWQIVGPSSNGMGEKLIQKSSTEVSFERFALPWSRLIFGDKLQENLS